MLFNRCTWFALFTLLFTSASPSAQTADELHPARQDADTLWFDARQLTIEGQGWSHELEAPYDRLPARARESVRPPVWELSRDSAGLCVYFASNAREIRVEWTLRSERLAMPHMPATGVSGVDLYARNPGGPWRWLGNGKPHTFPTNTAVLGRGLPAGEREFALYLPLYNGVHDVHIGVPAGAQLRKLARPRRHTLPIVFYGTSITQGACASRPGMVHTAILGRRLDTPVINLGFSGNGRLELALASHLAELEASIYVLDCLPNLDAKAVTERTVPFVEHLRAARASTPIVLVEDRTYANADFLPGIRQRNEDSRKALRAAYEALRASGTRELYYLQGENLLGDDGEATVDGSHPSDLGFQRQAAAFEPLLARLLAQRDLVSDPPGIPVRVKSLEVRRIWNEAPHNAFTDLVFHDGHFHCAFREGRGHVSTDGRIRILRSSDATHWEPRGLVALEGFDLRDADLSVTPDGRLMLLGGVAPRKEDGARAPTGTFVSFLESGSWTRPEIVIAPGRWLWRVTWHAGRAYGFSYPAPEGQGIDLLASRDGLDWSVVAPSVVVEGNPSEAQIRFDGDGHALALLRRSHAGALLLRSTPGYERWSAVDLGDSGEEQDPDTSFRGFGGPGFVETFPGVWLAAGRMHDDGSHTALTWLDVEHGSMRRLLRLPSSGDTSYPGLVWRAGKLFMSYYSSHEGQTCIYLAEIELELEER